MTDSDEEAEQSTSAILRSYHGLTPADTSFSALRQAEQAEINHFLELTRQRNDQRTISHDKQLEPSEDIDLDFTRLPNALTSLREIRSLPPRLVEHDALKSEASRRVAQLGQ